MILVHSPKTQPSFLSAQVENAPKSNPLLFQRVLQVLIIVHESRELPPCPAVHALAKCRHRFISTPCLSLGVFDVKLLAFATLYGLAHAVLFLCHHRFIHVLFVNRLLNFSLLFTLHCLMNHADK